MGTVMGNYVVDSKLRGQTVNITPTTEPEAVSVTNHSENNTVSFTANPTHNIATFDVTGSHNYNLLTATNNANGINQFRNFSLGCFNTNSLTGANLAKRNEVTELGSHNTDLIIGSPDAINTLWVAGDNNQITYNDKGYPSSSNHDNAITFQGKNNNLVYTSIGTRGIHSLLEGENNTEVLHCGDGDNHITVCAGKNNNTIIYGGTKINTVTLHGDGWQADAKAMPHDHLSVFYQNVKTGSTFSATSNIKISIDP